LKSKLRFNAEGNGFVAVYSDELKASVPQNWDLDISRISDVEYDKSRDVWVATRKDGIVIAEDKNRKECVRKEVASLNADLKHVATIT
jgi:hypothetical protein